MRVLFITTRFPGQAFRGDQLRAWQQLLHLGPRHEITLLCLDGQRPDAALWAQLLALCRGGIEHWPRNRGRLALGALAALPVRTEPLQSGMYRSRRLTQRLKRLLATHRFDLVHVQLIRLAALLPVLPPDLPCVLDLVDALSLNMQRRAARERWSRRWLFALEACRLAALEARLLDQVSAVAISAPADAERLTRHARDPAAVTVIPNGVDLAAFPWRAPQPRAAPALVFVGNLGYFPNLDAARWLLTELLPAVRRQWPAATLHLVGARPSAGLARLAARTPGATLVGEVPETCSWLHAASVMVCPLRAGSGQQIKLIEALAAGAPVISTAASAAAMGAQDGVHLLLADDGPSFVTAIARLQHEPALAGALSAAGRSLVEQHYAWRNSALALEQLWLARSPHPVS